MAKRSIVDKLLGRGKEESEEVLRLQTDVERTRKKGVRGWLASTTKSLSNWVRFHKPKAVLTLIIGATLFLTFYYATPWTRVGEPYRMVFLTPLWTLIIGAAITHWFDLNRESKTCLLNIGGKQVYVDNKDVEETAEGGELVYVTDRLGQRYISKTSKRRGEPARIHIPPGVKTLIGASVRGRESLTFTNCRFLSVDLQSNDYTVKIASSEKREAILAKEIEGLQSQLQAIERQRDQLQKKFDKWSEDAIEQMKKEVGGIVEFIFELQRGGMTEEELIQEEVMRQLEYQGWGGPGYRGGGSPYYQRRPGFRRRTGPFRPPTGPGAGGREEEEGGE